MDNKTKLLNYPYASLRPKPPVIFGFKKIPPQKKIALSSVRYTMILNQHMVHHHQQYQQQKPQIPLLPVPKAKIVSESFLNGK